MSEELAACPIHSVPSAGIMCYPSFWIGHRTGEPALIPSCPCLAPIRNGSEPLLASAWNSRVQVEAEKKACRMWPDDLAKQSAYLRHFTPAPEQSDL